MKKIINRPIYILLGISLIIRLCFFFYSSHLGESSFYLFDSYRYLQLGNNYFESGVYAEEISDPLFPSIFIPPGLPFIYYFLQSLGGIHLIILVQILVQLIILYYLIKFFHLIFDANRNLLIYTLGGFYAFDIPSIVLGNVLMGETFFALFLILFFYHFISYLKFNSIKKLVYSSIFLAISALIKPISFYLPIFIFLYLLISNRKEVRLMLTRLVCFLLPFYMITGLWVTRNYIEHQKNFYSYQANFNLFYYQAASIYSQQSNLPFLKARLELFEQLKGEFPPQKHFDQIEFYDKAGEKARKIILSAPHLFLKNMVKANVNLFLRPVRDYLKINWGSNELFHSRSKNNSFTIQFLTYWQILLNLFLTLLIPVGLVYLYQLNRNVFWFFTLLLGYFMLACSGPEIEARFRVPIFPIILLVDMAGLLLISEKIQKRKTRLQ